jgi:hypothetical protein
MDARMRRSLLGVGLTGAVLALGATFIAGVSTGFSVAVGAVIATGNLWALARIFTAILPSGEGAAEGARSQSRAGWSLVAILKLFALIGAVWLLMKHDLVSPLAMLVGFGSLPIGIALGSLVSDRSAPQDPQDERP